MHCNCGCCCRVYGPTPAVDAPWVTPTQEEIDVMIQPILLVTALLKLSGHQVDLLSGLAIGKDA